MSVMAADLLSEQRPVEQAFEELAAAILLVSSGRFPQVLITNLGHCDEAIDAKRQMANTAGVDLVPIARSDGRGCDVAVRAR